MRRKTAFTQSSHSSAAAPHLQNGSAFRDRFWSILLLFSAFWTFVPVFVIHNYRPDVLEMIATGQNWVLATPKHGALTCWLAEIIYQLTNRAAYAPYLTSQLCVFFSLAGISAFAKRYLPEKKAGLAVFCMLSYYFFHFESTLYNNNTTLGLFWIWTSFFGLRGLETGKKRWWVLTGIALGLGIYAKMTVVFLAFTIVLFLMTYKKERRLWLTSAPWLTVVFALLPALPLLKWNIDHQFAQIFYAAGSASDNKIPSLFGHLAAPFYFAVEQMLYIAPITISFVPLILGKKGQKSADDDNKVSEKAETLFTYREKLRYLYFLTAVPFGINCLFALLSGSPPRGALGCHLWYFLPVLLLTGIKTDSEEKPFRNARIVSLTVPVVIMFLFILGVWLSPAIEGHASRYHYPGKQIAGAVTRLWRERYPGPVPFVIGDEWITENVSVYAADRPRIWNLQWSTEEEFRQKGGVLLWEDGKPNSIQRKEEIEARFPYSGEVVSLTVKQQTPFDVPPAKVNIGFYPPQK